MSEFERWGRWLAEMLGLEGEDMARCVAIYRPIAERAHHLTGGKVQAHQVAAAMFRYCERQAWLALPSGINCQKSDDARAT